MSKTVTLSRHDWADADIIEVDGCDVDRLINWCAICWARGLRAEIAAFDRCTITDAGIAVTTTIDGDVCAACAETHVVDGRIRIDS